jgi:hypothetical protein
MGPITSITKHNRVMQYNKRVNAPKLNVNKRTELLTFFFPYLTNLTSTNTTNINTPLIPPPSFLSPQIFSTISCQRNVRNMDHKADFPIKSMLQYLH